MTDKGSESYRPDRTSLKAEHIPGRNAIVDRNEQVPAEIKGWNWGAFLYSIFWGFGNQSYLPLLCVIPGFNVIWMFVVGFKGQEWAWKKGGYTNTPEDIRLFQAIQATWNRAGFIMFIIAVLSLVAFLVFSLSLGLLANYNN